MCRAGTRNWGIFALAGMTIAYFLVFLVYIGLGFIQLHARPFRDLRTAMILFRLQVSACCDVECACCAIRLNGVQSHASAQLESPSRVMKGLCLAHKV